MAGSYELDWDGRSDFGERVPSGTYFFRLETTRVREAGKVVLVH